MASQIGTFKLVSHFLMTLFVGLFLLVPTIGCTKLSALSSALPSLPGGGGGESLSCPNNYVLVPANAELGTSEFCVATYEMRNVGGVPTSKAETLPWSNVSRNTALSACQSLGSKYDLISNAEWQSLARNIASVNANWSSSTVGNGYMNVGNADNGGASECDSLNVYVNTSCAPILASGNFVLKRTHTLSTGSVIWDLGANDYELVKDLSTAGQYGANSCADVLTLTNTAGDSLGAATTAFGLASVAGFTLDSVTVHCGGLGGLVNAAVDNTIINMAVVRGGSNYDDSGIFNADIGFQPPSGADPAFSFRCAYK